MKRLGVVFLSLLVLVIALPASAATATGTLAVTATIDSSIAIILTSNGLTLTGTGTDTASVAAGTITKYGTDPSGGFTRSTGASDWTLTGTFNVNVNKANLTSPNYTLTAALDSAAASGTSWKLNGGADLTTTASNVTTTGTYDSAASHTLTLGVTDAAPAAAVGRTISLVATSNP